jgi:hypothetical protein
MKKVVTILCCLVLVVVANAQDIFSKGRYQDTIRIESEKVDIECIFKYNQQKEISKWDTTHYNGIADETDHLIFVLKQYKSEIEKCNPAEIIYGKNFPTMELTIKKLDITAKYSHLSHESYNKLNIFRFEDHNGAVVIRFANIDDVLNFDFKSVSSQLKRQAIETHWYPETFEFTLTNGVLKPHRFSRNFELNTDTYISSIDFHSGLSLIKQKPTIDLGIGINLGIQREQMNKVYLLQKFCLSYKYMTYYDENAKRIKINGFLNGMYALNIPRTNRWLGVEAGYLLHRQGDLFGKNTTKVALVFMGGKIDFSSGVYISKNSVVPSLSIAFTGW